MARVKIRVKNKGKKRQKKHIPSQLVLLLLVVLAFVSIYIGYRYIAYIQSKSFYVQPSAIRSYIPPITVHPTQTPVFVKTLNAADYQIDTSTWKTYYDSTFDFSIRYPSNWIVTATDKNQGFYGSYSFGCKDLQSFLKTPDTCDSTIQNHNLTISAPGMQAPSSIALYIYTSAAGGSPPDTKLPIVINSNPYTLDINHYSYSQNGEVTSGYSGIYLILPITGQKSIWQKVHVLFSVHDADFPILVNLLESIKN